ncbi:MAG: hypothetical protein JXB13_11800 [Phycisphaerae bacterium]|nr:hypothetical protein [Phycisphaerae bacterium]
MSRLLQLLPALPKARRWVRWTLADHVSVAQSLSTRRFSRLPKLYPHELLDRVKIVVVQKVPRPPVEQWGLGAADQFLFVDPAGITLLDTIFLQCGSETNESLVFHELVHVVQWRTLGVNRFLGLYGLLLQQHGYFDNPLEVMARGFETRLEGAGPPHGVLPAIRRMTEELLAETSKASLVNRMAFALLPALRFGRLETSPGG